MKDSSYERGGLHCVYDRKTTIYGLEAGKITFFVKCVQGVHSNAFPYSTDLPVSSSLYLLYSSGTRLHHLFSLIRVAVSGCINLYRTICDPLSENPALCAQILNLS